MSLRISTIVFLILVLSACGERQSNESGGDASESAPTFSSIQKAAEQGDATSQYNFGFLYYEGKSVPQDYAEVRKWWLKAAEHGHVKAQSGLGMLYLIGEGGSMFETDLLFVGVVIVMFVGIAMSQLLNRVTSYFDRWRTEA